MKCEVLLVYLCVFVLGACKEVAVLGLIWTRERVSHGNVEHERENESFFVCEFSGNCCSRS